MKRRITVVALVCTLIAGWSNAWAGDIDSGTISVNASSNAFFSLTDREDDYSSGNLYFGTEVGYFFLKNFELGAQLSLQFSQTDESDAQAYTIGPYIAYYWPLNEKANFYSRFGVGYGRSNSNNDEYDYDIESTLTMLALEIGYEYFLTQNVSLGLGLMGIQQKSEREADLDGFEEEDDSTANQLKTMLKFNLYF